MSSSRKVACLFAFIALVAALFHTVNGESCDDAKKEIGNFAKVLLQDIEKKVCAKCKVHMNDLESAPNAIQYVEKEVMVEYATWVKNDMPLSKDEYKKIVDTVMDKCINKFKGKELCKEMKPKEGEIKACIIQNIMFMVNFTKFTDHLDKHCMDIRAFLKKNTPKYRKVIADWPANHKKACP